MADPALTVAALYRYPVKSFQGHAVDHVEVGPEGIVGDRRWALVDQEAGRVMSAKRTSVLLMAVAHDDRVVLPDGREVPLAESPEADAALSTWLDRPVQLTERRDELALTYEMTFDPPNDDAEWVDIPAPAGSFLDLAPVHLVAEATLAAGESTQPDLDWDVRRFRPNLVVGGELGPFAEDGWCPGPVEAGGAVLEALQPTVRCAMPLRAQPGLARQAALYRALDQLHANHLGIYLDVSRPGRIEVGDQVRVGAA